MGAFADIAAEDDGVLDIEIAPTLDQHLSGLENCSVNEEQYATRFLLAMAQIGVRVRVEVRADCQRHIWSWIGEDLHTAERSMRVSAMLEHLAKSGHRDVVIAKVVDNFQYDDHRAHDPRETTQVLRDAIASGLRILIDPMNRVSVWPRNPKDWGCGDLARDAEIARSRRAYFHLWCRFASRPHIRRAVMLCGRHDDNGWAVLEVNS